MHLKHTDRIEDTSKLEPDMIAFKLTRADFKGNGHALRLTTTDDKDCPIDMKAVTIDRIAFHTMLADMTVITAEGHLGLKVVINTDQPDGIVETNIGDVIINIQNDPTADLEAAAVVKVTFLADARNDLKTAAGPSEEDDRVSFLHPKEAGITNDVNTVVADLQAKV